MKYAPSIQRALRRSALHRSLVQRWKTCCQHQWLVAAKAMPSRNKGGRLEWRGLPLRLRRPDLDAVLDDMLQCSMQEELDAVETFRPGIKDFDVDGTSPVPRLGNRWGVR